MENLIQQFLQMKLPVIRRNSLFLEIFSLLIFLGNCVRSGCSTAFSCYEIGSESPKIENFPVKIPVSREIAWRPVRIPLRRQPEIPNSLNINDFPE
jgi:hypothetical protein